MYIVFIQILPQTCYLSHNIHRYVAMWISIPYCLPGVYFFPAIFNQATKQDRQLLWEETRAVYNL